jgi:hypothetical protein
LLVAQVVEITSLVVVVDLPKLEVREPLMVLLVEDMVYLTQLLELACVGEAEEVALVTQ